MREDSSRLLALVGAAAGIAAYLVALGGAQLWMRLEGAGLPADLALAAYDRRQLAAAGLRVLAAFAILYLVLLIFALAIRAGESADAPSSQGPEDAERRPRGALLQLVSVLAAAYVTAAAVPALLTLASAVDRLPGWLAIAVLTLSAGAVPLLTTAVSRRGPGEAQSPIRLPRVLVLSGALRRSFLGAAAVAAGALAHLAVRGSSVAALALIVVVWAGLSVTTLWVVDAAVASLAARSRAAPEWQQALAYAFALVVLGVILPLWLGLMLLGLAVLAALAAFREAGESAVVVRWMFGSLERTVLVLALVGVAGYVGLAAQAPQRFDRVSIPLAQGGTVHAALIGRTSGQLVLGVCSREDGGTSGAPAVVRVPAPRLDAITSGDYVFYTGDDATIVGIVADRLGLPALRFPAFADSFGTRPEYVCGDSDESPRGIVERLRRYAAR